MGCLVIRGGNALSGSCMAGGAKNAALPILAAALMAQDELYVRVPDLTDVHNMLSILHVLGCRAAMQDGWVRIDARSANRCIMPDDLSKRMRSSVFMMGPMVARFGQAEFTYPGGCEIGLRPIDIHLSGLREMGARVTETGGRILLCGRLRGAKLHLDYPSVGATENLLMAAVLAQGETVIENAAMEPEIVDLAAFLTAMGAKIRGAGGRRIAVEGVSRLNGCEYSPIPDRIVAGTYLAAAAAAGGDVLVRDARQADMVAILNKLQQMGCQIDCREGVRLKAPKRLRAFRTLETMPHPGFPTDMQAQMLTLETIAEGAGTVTENVFENRFGVAAELSKMGADIVVKDRTAFVRGVGSLCGAQVYAKDLRGGAALVIAGLCAQGETRLHGAGYIDRGYQHIEKTLRALGAQIRRE